MFRALGDHRPGDRVRERERERERERQTDRQTEGNDYIEQQYRAMFVNALTHH